MNKLLAKYLESHPYFQKGEDNFLRELIFSLSKEPRVLEIGTFKGHSAILMALAREDIFVTTIDFHVGIPEDGFTSSIGETSANIREAGVENRVCHFLISSQDYYPKDKFDLIFIDGDHTYLGVQHDFLKFLPFVKDTGIILFHDFNGQKGVTDFCNTLRFKASQVFKSMLAIRKCDLC